MHYYCIINSNQFVWNGLISPPSIVSTGVNLTTPNLTIPNFLSDGKSKHVFFSFIRLLRKPLTIPWHFPPGGGKWSDCTSWWRLDYVDRHTCTSAHACSVLAALKQRSTRCQVWTLTRRMTSLKRTYMTQPLRLHRAHANHKKLTVLNVDNKILLISRLSIAIHNVSTTNCELYERTPEYVKNASGTQHCAARRFDLPLSQWRQQDRVKLKPGKTCWRNSVVFPSTLASTRPASSSLARLCPIPSLTSY